MFSTLAADKLARGIRECERNQQTEFEVRVSLLEKRKQQPGHGHHDESALLHGVLVSRAKNFLESIPGVLCAHMHTQEHLYKETVSGTLRKIVSPGSYRAPVFLLKKRKMEFIYYDLDLKFSLASETRLVSPYIESRAELVRDKVRTSFTDPTRQYVRYDLTQVTTYGTAGSLPVVSHELEVEWQRGFSGTTADLIQVLVELVGGIQASPFVLTRTLQRSLHNEYAALVKRKFFAGAQPESLKRAHLDLMAAKTYAVTPKIDGERALVMVASTGHVVFVDRLMLLRDSGAMCAKWSNSILDAELTRADNLTTVHIFDALVVRGKDLRGNVQEDLIARLSYVEEFVDDVEPSVGARFLAKRHAFDLKKCSTLLEQAQECDGLIFTPVEDPYPTRAACGILKWKLPAKNSIDFLLEAVRPDPKSPPTFQIMYALSDGSLVPYAGELEFDHKIGPALIPHSGRGIAECVLDAESNKLVVARLREDKLRPNHENVVRNVLESMRDPVALDEIVALAAPQTHTSFDAMRQYHNAVKKDLVSRVGTPGCRVLDIGCGRGGDLNKWTHAGASFYVGLDVNADLLAEARERAKHTKMSTRFYEHDVARDVFDYGAHAQAVPEVIDWALLDEEYDSLVDPSPGAKFDVVSLQFCVHYFFSSRATAALLCETIRRNIADSGFVIITTLDGNMVYNAVNSGLFSDPEAEIWIDSSAGLAKRTREIARAAEFGTGFKVVFSGGDDLILSRYDLVEYVVFPDVLVSLMAKAGFALVDSCRFGNVSPYSGMNRSFIFERIVQ
jgi:SAM-dependent methyltransferase